MLFRTGLSFSAIAATIIILFSALSTTFAAPIPTPNPPTNPPSSRSQSPPDTARPASTGWSKVRYTVKGEWAANKDLHRTETTAMRNAVRIAPGQSYKPLPPPGAFERTKHYERRLTNARTLAEADASYKTPAYLARATKEAAERQAREAAAAAAELIRQKQQRQEGAGRRDGGGREEEPQAVQPAQHRSLRELREGQKGARRRGGVQ